ncbi:LysR family transcriptional regulator [Streptomyces sp. AC602_WCS936]|uniref:LysR family transcriptional regulator n=1 Tax=Streptomyces sp. AC602_WCS936 TaxID=2823685 RepID=UPI001C266436|nr:LysR family transcriptional regulator [Streptomyces sp. AC602_WCS936]
MVDLQLLQTLRVLYVQGTVTATARALHMSPSAVSQQLRRLAAEAGADLLRAEGRRVQFTAAGHVLLRHADLLCSQWERAVSELAEEADSPRRTLSLGGFATSIGTLLAPAARRLNQAEQPTRTFLQEAGTRECYEKLLAEEIDLAILTPLPGGPSLDDPRFEQFVLMDDLMDLAVPADHRLAAQSTVDLADASTEDWIAPHHDHTQLIESLCSASGFAPKFVHRADAWHAVLSLVGHGFGVCLVPRLAPSPRLHVARVRLRGQPPPLRRILVCVRSGTGQDPTISNGIDALRQQAHRYASSPSHRAGEEDGVG